MPKPGLKLLPARNLDAKGRNDYFGLGRNERTVIPSLKAYGNGRRRRNDYFGLGRHEREIESIEFIVERSRYFGMLDVISSIRSITIRLLGRMKEAGVCKLLCKVK